MARFFKHFDDLKPYISSAQANNSIDTLESFISNALRDYIQPLTGADWITGIEERMEAVTLTDNDKVLLGHLRAALANFAYMDFAQEGNMVVDDQGFTSPNTGNARAPYQWQIRKFVVKRRRDAWAAANALVKALEQFKADYDDWTGSDERVDLFSLFVWNSDIYNRYRKIDGFGTLVELRPYMKRAVDYTVKAAMGTNFYSAYRERFLDEDFAAGEAALLPFIQKIVAFDAVLHAADELQVELSPEGLKIREVNSTLNNDEGEKNAASTDAIKKHASQQAKNAVAEMREYLDTTSSQELYPEYFASDLYDEDDDFAEPNPDLYDGNSFMI